MEKDFLLQKDIAACVVLYNSEEQVFHNIGSYVNQVDKLYVIDNSEIPNQNLLLKIQTNFEVEYYWMIKNFGIAAALNKAARSAIADGYSYILMMDDDSKLYEYTVPKMVDYINQNENKARIGIVAAQSDPNTTDWSDQHVWYTITSGSLLNLRAYDECGPLMEELFIDGVDHEYCYRLKQFNFSVISLNYISMLHRMGNPEKIKLFNHVIYEWSSHNPIRDYYLVRNFLHILKIYKLVLPKPIKREIYYGVLKAISLDILFGTDRIVRLRYIMRAIADFKNGKLGQFMQLLK